MPGPTTSIVIGLAVRVALRFALKRLRSRMSRTEAAEVVSNELDKLDGNREDPHPTALSGERTAVLVLLCAMFLGCSISLRDVTRLWPVDGSGTLPTATTTTTIPATPATTIPPAIVDKTSDGNYQPILIAIGTNAPCYVPSFMFERWVDKSQPYCVKGTYKPDGATWFLEDRIYGGTEQLQSDQDAGYFAIKRDVQLLRAASLVIVFKGRTYTYKVKDVTKPEYPVKAVIQ